MKELFISLYFERTIVFGSCGGKRGLSIFKPFKREERGMGKTEDSLESVNEENVVHTK